MTSSTHNEISIIFGIETSDRDSPLVYIPSSKKTINSEGKEVFDWMALEMVDRRIRFVWNTGTGTRAISHNVMIETAYNLARQDDMWYKVCFIKRNHFIILSNFFTIILRFLLVNSFISMDRSQSIV